MLSVLTQSGSGSISSLYQECILYLRQHSSKEIQVDHPTAIDGPSNFPAIADELARLRIWGANSGAHHPVGSKYSLDHRLRDAKYATELLLRVLRRMKVVLVDGKCGKAYTHKSVWARK